MAMIALGVCGGIGAYKSVEVVRGLQKQGHDVVAVMTRSARQFVGELTFEAITRHRVLTSQFEPGANADIEHISLASSIDLLLVAPATANIIGKFANGIADDFLTSLYLATKAPVLMAPAMNTQHARARGRAAEPRRCWRNAACASSSRAPDISRAAGSAKGGSPSPRISSAAAEQAAHAVGPAAAARPSSSRRGRRAKPSIRCDSSAIGPAGRWVTRLRRCARVGAPAWCSSADRRTCQPPAGVETDSRDDRRGDARCGRPACGPAPTSSSWRPPWPTTRPPTRRDRKSTRTRTR